MLADNSPALQHDVMATARNYGPRPLPLFLDMVRDVALRDADLARRALAGLHFYAAAPRDARPPRAIALRHGRVRVDAMGDSGPVVLLVPSLINPSHILDLDERRSLLAFLARSGFRAHLLDWGTPTPQQRGWTVADHVEQLLLPVLRQLGGGQLGGGVHLVG
ncbi:MAG: hypothetical protein ACKOUM_11620 [Sphingopyxis sp.]